jgi:hypothetical protein
VGVVEPPPYPRIQYLLPHPAIGADDSVVTPSVRKEWLAAHVVVEEKLDGANVCLWSDDGIIRAAGRSGMHGQDRANQFGRLRAWVASNTARLSPLLRSGRVLYGEWLWLQHSIDYTKLPEYLIGLDIASADGHFLSQDSRNSELQEAGLEPPHKIFEGRLETPHAILALLRKSAYREGSPEGAVIRSSTPARALVKS